MAEDKRNDDVARALAILREADFPVERIRIVPAAGGPDTEVAPGTPVDRDALLKACREVLADGEPRAAKELARRLRAEFPGLTRKDVNSVLSTDGKDVVTYDRTTYTYRPWQLGDSRTED
jgi:hypothetical protein